MVAATTAVTVSEEVPLAPAPAESRIASQPEAASNGTAIAKPVGNHPQAGAPDGGGSRMSISGTGESIARKQ